MPWHDSDWYREYHIPDVIEDQVGCTRPTGILGPSGKELHRLEPVGFNGKTQLVYVYKPNLED